MKKKIKKIVFIRKENRLTDVYSTFSHPGLALPIIGTVLKKAGYDVGIYIDSIQQPSMDVLLQSDIIGFSVNSSCFMETYELAKELKNKVNSKIIFGGPHVTFLPDEALVYGDFVVRGEGEETILELVKALENDCVSFEHIKGLSWRDGFGQIHHNPDRPLIEELDVIPDHSLVVGYQKKIKSLWQKIFPMAMLVSTSRGCPYQCSFCTIPQLFGRKIRYRNHDLVIEDIKQQIRFSGHRYLYFADDNFAVNPQYTKALLAKIIEEKLYIRFSAQVRCEIVQDNELMELIKKAGGYLVFVGFESINDNSLQFYNKGGRQTKALIEHSIREFHRRSIMVHGMFVAGADSDEPGVALSTAKWAIKNKLESIQILPICPLPGTKISKQLKIENRIFESYNRDTEERYINYGVGNNVLFKPKMMSAIELQKEIYAAYKMFYNYMNVIKNFKKIIQFGIEPVIYQIIGSKLISKVETEVYSHIEWLRAMETYSEDKEEELVSVSS